MDRRARLRCPWAAAGPGRAHQNHKRRRCGGRRRVRRARAGFEIDHSEPQARVWRSRGRAAAHRHTQRPGPTGVEGAGGTGGHGRASRRGAERSEAA